jgi:hypothetical protein
MTSDKDIMLRLAETLGVEASAIGPTTTSTDIESWDSMGTMAILLCPQETTKLQSVASILKLLRDAGH